MSPQVLYRKWRSQTLAELIGQPHVTQTLLNALKTGSVSHAYLFCGPRGTGKTSTARILAKALNCLNNNGRGEPCNHCEMCNAITEDRAMDVIEIDAASNRGIDDIRDLREKVNYAPTQARHKVYIIDEFHMLSKDASNALLKTLEEPPSHVVFVLATTESHKVLPTILSRCQHFDFRRHSASNIADKLAQVCISENIDIDGSSLHLIARNSTGSMRDAYNLLEQLTTYYGLSIQFSQVQALLGITGDSRVKEIIHHIIDNNISLGLAALINVNNDGLDLHQFNREMVEYLRELLLVKTGASESVDLAGEDILELKELADKASLSQILNAVKLFGQIELGNNESSTLPMELALVECYLSHDKTLLTGHHRPVSTSTAAFKVSEPDIKHPNPPQVTQKDIPAHTIEESLKPDIKETVPDQAEPVTDTQPVVVPKLSSEIERLRLGWKQILDEVPPNLKRSNAIALLRSAGIKPVSIENETVVLSVKHGIYKEKMEKPEYQQIAEKIIGNFLGHACKIRCVHETENNHLVRAALKQGAQVTSVEEK